MNDNFLEVTKHASVVVRKDEVMKVSADFQLVSGEYPRECTFHGRRYVFFSMSSGPDGSWLTYRKK